MLTFIVCTGMIIVSILITIVKRNKMNSQKEESNKLTIQELKTASGSMATGTLLKSRTELTNMTSIKNLYFGYPIQLFC